MRLTTDARRTIAVFALGAITLGCGEARELTSEDVLAEAQAFDRPRAGLYTTTTQVVDFVVPGLDPAQADRIRTQMTGLSEEQQPYCLTEAEAEQSFETMLRDIGEGVNNMQCSFSRFDADPPQLDAQLGCSGPMGMSADLQMEGTTSAEGFDLTMDMEARNRMIPGGRMKMRMEIQSSRIGECSARDRARTRDGASGRAAAPGS